MANKANFDVCKMWKAGAQIEVHTTTMEGFIEWLKSKMGPAAHRYSLDYQYVWFNEENGETPHISETLVVLRYQYNGVFVPEVVGKVLVKVWTQRAYRFVGVRSPEALVKLLDKECPEFAKAWAAAEAADEKAAKLQKAKNLLDKATELRNAVRKLMENEAFAIGNVDEEADAVMDKILNAAQTNYLDKLDGRI